MQEDTHAFDKCFLFYLFFFFSAQLVDTGFEDIFV